MLTVFLTALALMLIFEGIFPFIAPDKWREMFAAILRMKSSEIRFIGLTSMLSGLIILFLLSL